MEYALIMIALVVGLIYVTGRSMKAGSGAQQVKNRHARRGMHGIKRR